MRQARKARSSAPEPGKRMERDFPLEPGEGAWLAFQTTEISFGLLTSKTVRK